MVGWSGMNLLRSLNCAQRCQALSSRHSTSTTASLQCVVLSAVYARWLMVGTPSRFEAYDVDK